MESYKFRKIEESDLEFVTSVYNYYIENTTVTWYIGKIDEDEVRGLVFFSDERYGSYIIENSAGESVGFCLNSRYKVRQAYDRTAEVVVYLAPGFTGKGAGSAAVNFIEECSREQGIKVLISVISGDNEASIRLFEKLDYEKCAHYKEVGEKFGKILDVVAYQKLL